MDFLCTGKIRSKLVLKVLNSETKNYIHTNKVTTVVTLMWILSLICAVRAPDKHQRWKALTIVNPLSTNPIKWSDTLKQFVETIQSRRCSTAGNMFKFNN